MTEIRTCERPGCGRPHCAKGMCEMHYNREREQGRHRVRHGQRINTRARTRAVSRLIKEHQNEFAVLLHNARLEVTAEAAELDALLEDQQVEPAGERKVWQYRPGPPSTDDEEPLDRVTLKERCPECQTFHETGHACHECRERAELAAAGHPVVQPRPVGTRDAIRRQLEAGKKAQWLIDQGYAYADVLATVRLINAERKGPADERQPA